MSTTTKTREDSRPASACKRGSCRPSTRAQLDALMALPTPTDWEDGPGPPSKQNVDAAWMLLAEMRPDLPDPTIGAYDNESVDLYWPGCLVNVDAEGATYHDSLTDESGHGIPPRFKAA